MKSSLRHPVGIPTYVSPPCCLFCGLTSKLRQKSPKIHQHTFELDFRVQKLKAALFRSTSDGTERPLGDVTFERFSLAFALAKYDMSVDIDLRFVAPCLVLPVKFIRSSELDPSL